MQLPMDLAAVTSAVEVPAGRYAFEPKYDGWRVCGCWDRARGWARLRTRTGSDVTDRFPEVVEAVARIGDVALDGELVAAVGFPPRLEHAGLRAHRERRRALGIGVYLLAFDVLAADGQDLRSSPYRRRRAALEDVLGRRGASRVQLVPSTMDRTHTRAWLDPSLGEVGIEGVVAKPLGRPYRSGRDSGWIKTQHLVTTAAVIGGVTGTRQRPRELVLVAREPSAGDRWLPTGVTGPIAGSLQEELASRLVFAGRAPARLPGSITGPAGDEVCEYWPARPELVVDVVTEAVGESGRRRRPGRVLRLRGDLAATELSVYVEHDG